MVWQALHSTWSTWATSLDHKLRRMPVVILNLISTCDSRCVACDYWKVRGGPRLGLEAVDRLIPELQKLHTRYVLLSGGEPLIHPDLPSVCRRLHRAGLVVLVHTNGVRLVERLEEIGPYVERLFVSLDAATSEIYRRMRGVDGLDNVLEGVRRAKRRFPRLRVGSRSVLMKGNLSELEPIVALGLREGLQPLSFLGADVHSDAFGRRGRDQAHLQERLPSIGELEHFRNSIEGLTPRWGSGVEPMIEGGLASLWRIHARYLALARGELPESPACNAPWHSVVIEPDGAARPCFFQPAYGRLNGQGLVPLLNGTEAVDFRRGLDVGRSSICRQCVCSKRFKLWPTGSGDLRRVSPA